MAENGASETQHGAMNHQLRHNFGGERANCGPRLKSMVGLIGTYGSCDVMLIGVIT